MRADLHMHSLCSDGSLPPEALARRAAEAGVELFSLTDHDNMSGAAEAQNAAKKYGLHFVRGIEISSYLGATKVHVLGYGCEENAAYFRFLEERKRGARLRAEDALQKANAALSLDVTMDEVEAYHVRKEAPVHTMHVVRAYARRLNADMGALYRELFAPGGTAYSDLYRPAPTEAVRLVHEMGGIAVLAHPAQILVLPEEDSRRFSLYTAAEKEEIKLRYIPARTALMEELVRAGADGIECTHSTHTEGETEEFLAFAKAHGLLITGGSDFHSDGAGRAVGMPFFDAADVAGTLLSLKGSV